VNPIDQRRIYHALESVLLSLQGSSDEISEKLVCFCPMMGANWSNDLMIIGRALYGWSTQGFSACDVSDEQRRRDILNETIRLSSSQDGCAISRLHKGWKEQLVTQPKGYNPKKSNFWKVGVMVGSVLTGLEPGDLVLNRLYWSNIYKLSPHAGRNPGRLLRDSQAIACAAMLKEEITIARPKRILFMTGNVWANAFLSKVPDRQETSFGGRYVEKTGFFSTDALEISYVVVKHPERKNRQALVTEIRNAFAV
jgi:hypothetical protein